MSLSAVQESIKKLALNAKDPDFIQKLIQTRPDAVDILTSLAEEIESGDLEVTKKKPEKPKKKKEPKPIDDGGSAADDFNVFWNQCVIRYV